MAHIHIASVNQDNGKIKMHSNKLNADFDIYISCIFCFIGKRRQKIQVCKIKNKKIIETFIIIQCIIIIMNKCSMNSSYIPWSPHTFIIEIGMKTKLYSSFRFFSASLFSILLENWQLTIQPHEAEKTTRQYLWLVSLTYTNALVHTFWYWFAFPFTKISIVVNHWISFLRECVLYKVKNRFLLFYHFKQSRKKREVKEWSEK